MKIALIVSSIVTSLALNAEMLQGRVVRVMLSGANEVVASVIKAV